MEGASDQENTAPGEEHSLRKMFVQGTEQIGTHRSENLFQSLEERTLTEEEQRIIDQRVALQRRMFEEYERRERKRKVAELREVCPDLREEEAERALQLCDGREDEAAAQLVSDSAFRRRVQSSCGTIAEQPAAAAPAPVPRKEASGSSRQPSWQAKPGPRPKLIDPKTLGGNVFVGAFRGKGFKPAPKGRQPARRASAQAAAATSDSEEEDEEQEAEEQESEQHSQEEQQVQQQAAVEDEEQQQAAVVQQQPQIQQQQQQQQHGGQQQGQTSQAAPLSCVHGEPGRDVLLWPAAAAEAAEEHRQRYVLVQADTLQAPTDSELRAARRQLGEPSVTALPGMSEQPTPASAARSRPEEADLAAALQRAIAAAAGVEVQAAAQAENETDAPAERAEKAASGSPASERAQQPQQYAGQPDVPSAARGCSSRRAVARRPARRAASAALSDSSMTEEELSPSSDEEEAAEQGSSDDDDFAPASRRRRQAASSPPPRRARPSRAAKNAAAATLAAYAIDSGEEWDADAVAADSSDDEEGLGQRPGRRRGGTRSSAIPASATKKASPARKKQRVEREDSGPAAGTTAAVSVVPAPPVAGSPASPAASQQQRREGGEEQGVEPPQELEQPRRSSRRSPAAAEPSDSGGAGPSRPPQQPRARAISSTGHTCRGRVKQKSHKSADLVAAGALRAEKGWYNAGYIFPEGFHSRTLFRSSVAIDQLCVHECHIIGKGGQFWPQPTFKVVALDRPDEPLVAKSCTGCWTGILKRINAEIEARRRAGEALPPPPKTAIAGPEYFGLNQPNIQQAVEALDPEQLCAEYWAGKRERMAAAAGLPVAAPQRAQRVLRQPSTSSRRAAGGGAGGKGRKRRGGSDTEDEGAVEEEEDETRLVSSKWSAVTRAERYRNRLQENGEDTSVLDKDNPLPHFTDPITMSAVVRPAISPYGYVAGLATWKVVLAEKQQCPFTNQPLQFEQLKLLTKTNIHLHRDKIVNGTPATLAS